MILPQPGESFEWRQTAFGPALVCRPLERVARHLFTTRPWTLGASSLASPAAWSELAAAVDTTLESLIRLKQVHGQATIIAERIDPAAMTNPPEGDIVLSGADRFAIAVQAADCVPLLIADRRLGVVAAAHAGWRGLAQGVPRQAVVGLVHTYGSRPQDLLAAIGPSVGSCCYEVGTDVIEAFVAGGFASDRRQRWFSERPTPTLRNPSVPGLPPVPRRGHAYFDGWTCAREQLLEAGLPDTSVFGAELCTASHSTVLCSYRCAGRHTGRIAGVIRARIAT
ncbi:MAG: peptidoglycan editing factor PgeF [Vicinamibacterales bacterium]